MGSDGRRRNRSDEKSWVGRPSLHRDNKQIVNAYRMQRDNSKRRFKWDDDGNVGCIEIETPVMRSDGRKGTESDEKSFLQQHRSHRAYKRIDVSYRIEAREPKRRAENKSVHSKAIANDFNQKNP